MKRAADDLEDFITEEESEKVDVSSDDSTDEDDWRPVTKRRRGASSTETSPAPVGESSVKGDHRSKRSLCPVDGCRARSKHLKHHAWEQHITRVFWDRPWQDLNASPAYHRLRADCLETIAKHLRGPVSCFCVFQCI